MEERIEFLPVNRDFPQLDSLRQLYDASFPDCERKPFEMVLQGIDTKKMDGYVLLYDGKVAGLAFMILGDNCAVIDYLAVDPGLQGRSLGTWMLSRLEKLYPKPLIVEIESTRKEKDETSDVWRRKQFYLRSGFFDCQSLISLFGVEMELLSTIRPVLYEEYEQVMHNYFERELHKQLFCLDSGSIHDEPSGGQR